MTRVRSVTINLKPRENSLVGGIAFQTLWLVTESAISWSPGSGHERFAAGFGESSPCSSELPETTFSLPLFLRGWKARGGSSPLWTKPTCRKVQRQEDPRTGSRRPGSAPTLGPAPSLNVSSLGGRGRRPPQS